MWVVNLYSKNGVVVLVFRDKAIQIPRYVKSTLPFSSIGYKRVLRKLKEKRLIIEKKETELEVLKLTVEELSVKA